MDIRSAPRLTFALFLAASACSPGAGDEQQVVGNAIAAEERIDGEAQDRAQHLDTLSTELAAQANRTHGAERDALHHRSDAAVSAAAEIRAEGAEAGAAAADRIEEKAGLINKQ